MKPKASSSALHAAGNAARVGREGEPDGGGRRNFGTGDEHPVSYGAYSQRGATGAVRARTGARGRQNRLGRGSGRHLDLSELSVHFGTGARCICIVVCTAPSAGELAFTFIVPVV